MTEKGLPDIIIKPIKSLENLILHVLKSERKNWTGIVNLITSIGVVFAIVILSLWNNLQNPILDRIIMLILLIIFSSIAASYIETANITKRKK